MVAEGQQQWPEGGVAVVAAGHVLTASRAQACPELVPTRCCTTCCNASWWELRVGIAKVDGQGACNGCNNCGPAQALCRPHSPGLLGSIDGRRQVAHTMLDPLVVWMPEVAGGVAGPAWHAGSL
jgi:hypothetical protein